MVPKGRCRITAPFMWPLSWLDPRQRASVRRAASVPSYVLLEPLSMYSAGHGREARLQFVDLHLLPGYGLDEMLGGGNIEGIQRVVV
jgi:hypothetical protein